LLWMGPHYKLNLGLTIVSSLPIAWSTSQIQSRRCWNGSVYFGATGFSCSSFRIETTLSIGVGP